MVHRQRIDEARNSKEIYQVRLHHRWREGRRNARWKDDVGNDKRKEGILNWRQVVEDRNGWSRATEETLILLG
jgi:hypothetical protein